MLKKMAKIQLRQDRMEEDLTGVQQKLEVVSNELREIREIVKVTDTKLETIIEAKLVESVEELKKGRESESVTNLGLKREEVLEEIEIEKRKLNLVIIGLKEENDEQLVKDLFTVLVGNKGVRAISRVERIGRVKPGTTRPVRVLMANTDSRTEILQSCPDLRKHEEYKKVYISPDLTRKQQESDKIIRDKLKEMRTAGETNIRIKRGKIVKNSDGKELVLFPPLMK